jgi:hypothetical protein
MVFIIIDALDECHLSNERRNRLLSEVFSFQTQAQVNLFATPIGSVGWSRQDPHDRNFADYRMNVRYKEVIVQLPYVRAFG